MPRFKLAGVRPGSHVVIPGQTLKVDDEGCVVATGGAAAYLTTHFGAEAVAGPAQAPAASSSDEKDKEQARAQAEAARALAEQYERVPKPETSRRGKG
jgi:hypothetical protein